VLSRKRLVRGVPTSTEYMPCRVGRFSLSLVSAKVSDAVLNVICSFCASYLSSTASILNDEPAVPRVLVPAEGYSLPLLLPKPHDYM
jgi:hypothetical protein